MHSSSWFTVSMLVGSSIAVPWLEPIATPTGLMADVGMSLMPTQAPELGGIPRELLRRQNAPYPPPNNWCGFVGGDPNNALSCVATKTCVFSGPVLGCCDAGLIATCTNLFTTCANFGDQCNNACESNDKILKCSESDIPYCGTFNFNGGTKLFNCQSVANQATTVEFLADYYLSELGSTLASSLGPVVVTGTSASLDDNSDSAVTNFGTGTAVSNAPIQTGTSSSGSETVSSSSSSGIGVGAIVGIAVGVVLLILIVVGGLIAWCCIRRRNRNRIQKANGAFNAAQSNPNQPMQQSPNQPQNQFSNPNSAYQPVPQQDPSKTGYYPQQQQQQQSQPQQGPYGAAPAYVDNMNKAPVSEVSSQPRYSVAGSEASGNPNHMPPPIPQPGIPEADAGSYYNNSNPQGMNRGVSSRTAAEVPANETGVSNPSGSPMMGPGQGMGARGNSGGISPLTERHGSEGFPSGQLGQPGTVPQQASHQQPYEVSGVSSGPVSDVYEMPHDKS